MSDPELDSAFVELTADDFPFVVQLHDEDTGELIWESTITGAGALKVPGFAPRKVATTIINKDGFTSVVNSAGDDVTPVTAHDHDDQSQMIFSCIPYDVTQYSPLRLSMWRQGLQQSGHATGEFTPYPDSTPATCSACGISVALGPRQKAAMDVYVQNGKPTLITCMLCSAMMKAASSSQENPTMSVINLGNPDDPNG